MVILVIVESPGKIKKISGYLGKDYVVLASFGHIMDLDPKSMSVDIENDFTPHYKTSTTRSKVIKELKAAYSKATDVLLATDEDREGEMIAWSIAEVLKLKKPKRIIFNSITKTALEKAVANPTKIDENIINAQQTRRILDRIIGFELSSLLWKVLKQGSVSAGRVQSVVVRLILDKENDVRNFFDQDKGSSYNIVGTFSEKGKDYEFDSNLKYFKKIKEGGVLVGESHKLETLEQARDVLGRFNEAKFTVVSRETRDSLRASPPPFTTSSMQQIMHQKVGFTVKRTMMAAQRLYENGHITYMRTDSTILSKDALEAIGKYVSKEYGGEYYKLRQFVTKGKTAQEAHEAVRPTHVDSKELHDDKLDNDARKLYDMIWKRTIASQMSPAKFNIVTVQINNNQKPKLYFESNGEEMVFDGWMKVYGSKEEKKIKLPKANVQIIYKSISATEDFEKPPSRYNEASLVNKLDPKNLGIGRPSTYASIITTIQDRHYVELKDVEGHKKNQKKIILVDGKIKKEEKEIMLGQEKNKLVVTSFGELITNFLEKYFPVIMDYKFTAQMETNLDLIAEGKLDKVKTLKKFYSPFRKSLDEVMSSKVAMVTGRVVGIDPETDKDIVATMGKYGPIVKIQITKTKAKYAPIKKPLTIDTITLDDALELFEYPKDLGKIGKKPVVLMRGKFGLYVVYDGRKFTVASGKDVNLKEAEKIIKEKETEYQKMLKKSFSDDASDYQVKSGRYGLYMQVINKKTKKSFNVSISDKEDIDKMDVARAKELVTSHFNKPKKSFGDQKGKGKYGGKKKKY
jgi:DNA topoisomerase I